MAKKGSKLAAGKQIKAKKSPRLAANHNDLLVR